MNLSERLYVEALFDEATASLSYLVLEKASGQCALIDSVLDYDAQSGHISHESADRLIERVRALDATVQWILETHVHADHLSAASYLKSQLNGDIAIGRHITQVQRTYAEMFHVERDLLCDGSQFDVLIDEDQHLPLGDLVLRVLHTPGHTPACVSYLIEDADVCAVFVGDTLFTPDYGTARCDFPGADARTLYRSIQRILALPNDTRLFMCHDYRPGGRALRWVTTVAEQREHNVHIHQGIEEDAFVALRESRDKTLSMPKLIEPAVRANVRNGHQPCSTASDR